MRLCLDLCSGIGGFSKAFRDSDKWEVVTVDYNAKFNPTMVLDLIDVVEHGVDYVDFWMLKPDVILASPPCERWSIANSSWPGRGIYRASRVLGAVLEIIAIMKPKGWIIENPRGRMRWFLAKPTCTVALRQFGYRTVKPTDFWTNLDLGLLKSVSLRNNPDGCKFESDVPRASHKRAEMPYGLSQTILNVMSEGD